MASNIRGNSKKISVMAKADSSGVMGESTRVAGIVASKVASATTLTNTESNGRDTGSMADASAGWTTRVKRSEHIEVAFKHLNEQFFHSLVA